MIYFLNSDIVWLNEIVQRHFYNIKNIFHSTTVNFGWNLNFMNSSKTFGPKFLYFYYLFSKLQLNLCFELFWNAQKCSFWKNNSTAGRFCKDFPLVWNAIIRLIAFYRVLFSSGKCCKWTNTVFPVKIMNIMVIYLFISLNWYNAINLILILQ